MLPGAALARAADDVPYAVADVYSTALRFVRLDKGCKVVDKDAEAAFVAFECEDDEHKKRGSVEMFRATVGGRDGARVQVALGDDPHYMELRWLELIERKLKEERGTPQPLPAPSPPPHKPTDGGT